MRSRDEASASGIQRHCHLERSGGTRLRVLPRSRKTCCRLRRGHLSALNRRQGSIPPRTGSRQRAIPDQSTAPCRKSRHPWRSGTFLPDNTCGCSRSRWFPLRRKETVSSARGIVTRLLLPRPQMHLHTARLGIEPGDMLKLFQDEIRIQFPIDARQQIQIERRRHSQRIVIGRQQLRDRLFQVGA